MRWFAVWGQDPDDAGAWTVQADTAAEAVTLYEQQPGNGPASFVVELFKVRQEEGLDGV